jgi:hypothetical protein
MLYFNNGRYSKIPGLRFGDPKLWTGGGLYLTRWGETPSSPGMARPSLAPPSTHSVKQGLSLYNISVAAPTELTIPSFGDSIGNLCACDVGLLPSRGQNHDSAEGSSSQLGR